MIDYSKNEIFKLLYPNENDMLSSLSGKDIQNILVLMDDFYLVYRDTINIPKNITFGIEIEYENALKKMIDKRIENLFGKEDWIIKTDASLNDGGEINSPVLFDTKKCWTQIKEVCEVLNCFSQIGTKAGGHIHVGSYILGDDMKAWKNFIKLWSVYENIIFRFANGDYLSSRPKVDTYAPPISEELWEVYDYLKDSYEGVMRIINKVNKNRNQAVNFKNVRDPKDNIVDKNTIEFRCPNGSLEPVIWQNNINLFIKMLLYSKRKGFNNGLLNQRHEKLLKMGINFDWYDEIFLEQALEFCDLIFDNNLDKVYFLRQYLKSFEVRQKDYTKTRSFYK